jgi:hypothetical protein
MYGDSFYSKPVIEETIKNAVESIKDDVKGTLQCLNFYGNKDKINPDVDKDGFLKGLKEMKNCSYESACYVFDWDTFVKLEKAEHELPEFADMSKGIKDLLFYIVNQKKQKIKVMHSPHYYMNVNTSEEYELARKTLYTLFQNEHVAARTKSSSGKFEPDLDVVAIYDKDVKLNEKTLEIRKPRFASESYRFVDPKKVSEIMNAFGYTTEKPG